MGHAKRKVRQVHSKKFVLETYLKILYTQVAFEPDLFLLE